MSSFANRSPSTCLVRTSISEQTRHANATRCKRPVCQSAQRELNPHFRHGKAVGYRYNMGAIFQYQIVKETLEHPTNLRSVPGLELTLPHYECGVLAAGRLVLR